MPVEHAGASVMAAPVAAPVAAPISAPISAPMPIVAGAGAGAARRSRGLADIAPKYVAKSGLCEASDMESPRGTSIRIQHLTAAAAAAAASAASQPPADGRSRFPKLDECAHFHYDHIELGPFQVSLYEEELKPLASEDTENKYYHVSVTSLGKTWVLRRSYDNFRMLDTQLHRCIYDRKFSGLHELPPEENVPGVNHEESVRRLLTDYLTRFSKISGNLINCGPVLNWLELDNRGRRLLVPDGDNCPINTPAVAAAYAVKRYTAQAGDEISFEVGDMISVIDMPPPEESVWWRGKRGFQVGFFPCECVAVIGDKVPRNLQLPTPPSEDQPSKPVLRKHGKLIAFFRSFILSRPSRRRLKQSGILKERVFGCDLGEHLLNSGHEIPMVLKCCAEFIETNGIVDGIYRLSGVNSNIQKLRNAFDEDRVPALYEDEAILQDIHSVASLLKMYFRELPNPLCTYQLYHTFVNAVQSTQEERNRLARMRDAVQQLPPPHYRTLEYLMRHLARVAQHGTKTGMTPRNVAIVWAPNLLRCKELEVGGVAALQGVGVQAVVTEFLVCYTDLIFSDALPPIILPLQDATPKRSRPKSLAISTPTKLLSLEEARLRALSAGKTEQEYIEVGGGPSNLPAKYHTVIELPGSGRKRSGSKRSPLGWKSFFSKSGRKSSSAPQRKASTPSELGLNQEKAVTEMDLAQGRRRLRPVKSAESLASGANSSRNSAALEQTEAATPEETSTPAHGNTKPSGHSRSVSHDSYFDSLAETPLRTGSSSRPSQLPEEENEENFSSSLDLSEIHLNFDLEESEMRIFSEDETLVSTSAGSGSFVSTGSPRVGGLRRAQQNAAAKRLPMRELPPPRARPEDSYSGCVSTDPSPKKQKTCGSPGSSRSKRSRLEEQLGPAAEFRYIDSQSPENQQMLVQADVHEQFAPERKFSASTPNSLSCNKMSPSLAEATVSDNESFNINSSGLTTPDTPLLVYTPLRDDTNSSNTTPDYENLHHSKLPTNLMGLPGGRYERLETPSPSPTGPGPLDSLLECSPLGQDCSFDNSQYENIPPAGSLAASGDLPPAEASYVNMAAVKTDTAGSPVHSPVECRITIVYENIRSPKKLHSPTAYESMNGQSEEEKQEGERGDYEPVVTQEDLSKDSAIELCSSVYQNIPEALELQQEDEHLYEDIQIARAANELQSAPPCQSQESDQCEEVDPDRQIYQQVKNFRQSIHEVNQLLDPVYAESGDSESVVQCEGGVDCQPAEEESVLKQSSCLEQSSCMSVEGEDSGKEVRQGEVDISSIPPVDTVSEASCVGMDVEIESHAEPSVGEPPPEEHSVTEETGDSVALPAETPPACTPKDPSSEEQTCRPHTFCSGSESVSLRSAVGLTPESVGESSSSRGSLTVVESPVSSPEHRSSLGSSTSSLLDSNRRKFESEIGRDILHERKMKQELQEVRSSPLGVGAMSPLPLRQPPPAKTGGKCNVKELLSRFEASPTEESPPPAPGQQRALSLGSLTPQPTRRSDPTPARPAGAAAASHGASHTASLPPCARARAARAARTRNAAATLASPLSVSLDGDRFPDPRAGAPAAAASKPLVRVQTSPDINVRAGEGDGPATKHLPSPTSASTVLKNVQNTVDLDDPERRQRIEKYKEERRMFLREKYRSESFRGERDEIVARLKQKASKAATSPGDESEPASLEPGRRLSAESEDEAAEASRARAARSAAHDLLAGGDDPSRRARFFDEAGLKASREGWGPAKAKSASPTRRLSPRKTSESDPATAHAELEKTVFSRSPELPELRVPGKGFGGAPERRRSQPAGPASPKPPRDAASAPGRSPLADRRDSPRRRAASDAHAPSFFIKDMAALFEGRDADAPAPRGAHPKLSSA